MDTEDRIWELMAAKLAGEITTPETLELSYHTRFHPELNQFMQTMDALWQPLPACYDTYKEFDKLQQRISGSMGNAAGECTQPGMQ